MEILPASEYVVPILDVTRTDQGRIQTAHYLGTGFFITDEWLITCKHVVAGAQHQLNVIYKAFGKSQVAPIWNELTEIREHSNVDLALAKVGQHTTQFYKPMRVDFDSERFLGRDVMSYGYVSSPTEGYKVGLIPRLFKGYIMRSSADLTNLEISFSALSGMSGSPIWDVYTFHVLGVIVGNYRSQVLEDYYEKEYEQNGEPFKKTYETYKVVDFAQALDLAPYREFVESVM